LQEHETTTALWCFDDLHSLRKEVLPCYKAKRKESDEKRDPALQKRVIQCRRLITRLRDEILPDFGYTPHWQSGLEADDMIAAACKSLHKDERYQNYRRMIVSTDGDLWQLLDPQTTMYSPSQNKYYTARGFEQEHGIPPKLWSLVKAIAGCTSDNVPGIAGVGEKSAVKYILGTLTGKKLSDIEANWELIYFNRGLVKLPHKATVLPTFGMFDGHSEEQWLLACERWDVEIWANSLSGWFPSFEVPF
jgi:5'-3' exonuclease